VVPFVVAEASDIDGIYVIGPVNQGLSEDWVLIDQLVTIGNSGECERSVGTVFQLPSPDAIYSRDEEKERKCSRTVHVLLRQGEGQKGRKRLGQQPSHVTSGSARYSEDIFV
jgi:hypothetical protein